MGVCNWSIFCCTLLYVPSSFAIILMGGGRELVALLSLSSWWLVIVVWLFLAMSWVCLQFLIVVFSGLLTYYSKSTGDYNYFVSQSLEIKGITMSNNNPF